MAESSLNEVEGSAAIAAYREALCAFTEALVLLHISYGAPSYRDIVRASKSPKLTNAGINEALTGKRLPSQAALLEFVRVVSAGDHRQAPAQALDSAQTALIQEWGGRWQSVKLLQRQAQAPLRHLRASVQDTLDEARRDAEAVRSAAHAEAGRVLDEARAEAARLRSQARGDEAEPRPPEASTGDRRNAREPTGPLSAWVGLGLWWTSWCWRSRVRVPVAGVCALGLAGAVALALGGFNEAPDTCTSALHAPAGAGATPDVRANARSSRTGARGAANDVAPQMFVTQVATGYPLGFPTAAPTTVVSPPPTASRSASPSAPLTPSAIRSKHSTAKPKSGDGCG
ncbi:hypothetical protein [Streptomyces sp. NPDC002952]|uniref:hypothetical protein n=1 Tax=Streptomyces sp. NPDC002952 TaxID=3364673 RepID=UPI0036C83322